MKKAKRTPNKQTILSQHKKGLWINDKLLFDYRLSNTELITLARILYISDNFNISIDGTSKILKLSKMTFLKALKNYELLGYLETEKNGNNKKYVFKDTSKYIVDFKPYLIDQYTTQQLNALLNNNETPTKYKNLIKKYFNASLQDEESFNKILQDIKNFEPPKDILKNQIKQADQEQNEIDIIDYITSH